MSETGAEPEVPLSGEWQELATGVYRLTTAPAAVNLGLIVGSDSAVLVDTGSTPAQGLAVRRSVASVTDLPLSAVIVTHWHYDHAFGLAAFDDLVTIGHETVRDRISSSEAAEAATELGIDAGSLALPNREIVLAAALDLGGDRRVEVAHIGRGHTEGDLVVVVPDAGVVFVGDLLESAGPPWFGADSVPMEWAATLDGVIGLMTPTVRAVPGHGEPVDREFVFNQRGEIAAVAGEIRRLVEAGVAQSAALSSGSWPYPEQHVAAGIAPGYGALSGLGVKGTRPTLPLA
ncbi:glyoxylase-like metal-dependent hydrolase (beta-lactamase superfamily II) [Microlunatus panaciterrae]|uniref:Glyoxylase-like metal-dependent hydrolase (Beta-lactamase superfamily II) n=1 Tax=Microlunatus panaciterrae TaxID=400768 RepID=A0ABS2RGI6_9ACTN|nr:MBL fold metallo-hydrolase [Microlunatus panaciterrae]MBM7797793.1 glyoxylase-like metal-dependent hydrolase (beta-lactamase superfamily II) [Microlunatus panaciterrae]